MKLNLGCGFKHKEGFTNVDILPCCNPDLLIDIGKNTLPVSANTVDYIYSRHLFEHISDFEHALKECHRVLTTEGKMDMVLPYATSLGGDYEYHYIRPRYWVFMDFEERKDPNKNRKMDYDLPLFRIKRYLTFPWWSKFMEIVNRKERWMYIYETTGLRYIFPGHELILEFKKIE